MKHRSLVLAGLLCLTGGLAAQDTGPAKSNTVENSVWNGGTGNWSTAADWTPSGAPNNGTNTYNVTIATGSDLVSLNMSATINALTLGSGSGNSTLENATGLKERLTIAGVFTENAAADFLFGNASILTVSGSGSNAGYMDFYGGSSASFNGAFTNTGRIDTNGNNAGGANSLTFNGAFTNSAGAWLNLGAFGSTADSLKLKSLTNSGRVTIGSGSSLNLTGQPNGITDVLAGSEFDVYGVFTAGTANAFASLASVEGTLYLENAKGTGATPGSGTLTLGTGSYVDVDSSSSFTVTGNLNSSGTVATNGTNGDTGANQLTVTGSYTNNAGAWLNIGAYNDTADVVNIGTLTNKGRITIGSDATLNLTAEPNGVADIGTGSEIDLYGTFTSGTANALAKLGSVEGSLFLENGKSTADAPAGGILTLAAGSYTDVDRGSIWTIAGNVNSSGRLDTNGTGSGLGANSITVTGTYTNNAGGWLNIGAFNDTADQVNLAALTNNGRLTIGSESSLNLTAQPGGLTAVAAGSEIDLFGTFTAGGERAGRPFNRRRQPISGKSERRVDRSRRRISVPGVRRLPGCRPGNQRDHRRESDQQWNVGDQRDKRWRGELRDGDRFVYQQRGRVAEYWSLQRHRRPGESWNADERGPHHDRDGSDLEFDRAAGGGDGCRGRIGDRPVWAVHGGRRKRLGSLDQRRGRVVFRERKGQQHRTSGRNIDAGGEFVHGHRWRKQRDGRGQFDE